MSTTLPHPRSPHPRPTIFAAWLIRVALLVLYVPVQAALLFVRAMLGLDAWASAIVQGEPEKMLAATPLRPAESAMEMQLEDDFAMPQLHEIPVTEIRYHA